ncbi:MAG: 30S ribosomal protein S9 [Phycisphaerae bacterium]
MPASEPTAASAPEPAAPVPPLTTPVATTPVATTPATTTLAPGPKNAAQGPKYGYYWGTGRRKSAIARVRIREGTGKFLINKRKLNDYFSLQKDRDTIVAPLKATDSAKRVDVFVNIGGGGITGQAGAILLGLARALRGFNPDCEPILRDGKYLTRDSRRVERKKYGQRGARRRFQFSKR